jgi:hypothetical protein
MVQIVVLIIERSAHDSGSDPAGESRVSLRGLHVVASVDDRDAVAPRRGCWRAMPCAEAKRPTWHVAQAGRETLLLQTAVRTTVCATRC